MSTVGTHFDKWIRGLDLNHYDTRHDLANEAFKAGFAAALTDKKAMMRAVAGELDGIKPGMSGRLTAFARKELKR